MRSLDSCFKRSLKVVKATPKRLVVEAFVILCVLGELWDWGDRMGVTECDELPMGRCSSCWG